MMVQIGSTGDLVKKIQAFLGLTADGSFGPGTQAAVIAWQTKNGLTPDGIVGQSTLDKMGIINSTEPIIIGPVDFSKLKGIIPDRIFAILPDTLPKYGVNTPLRISHFIAQVSHESDNFTIKTESLYYTTPSRIVEIWPTRFNLDGSDGKHNANEFIKNEEKLSDAVYEGRMGDTQPGDGFRFRGAGFLQLTGRESFTQYSKYIGKDIGETADLVRSSDQWAMDAALWEYSINMKLNLVADQGPTADVVKKITCIINGGYIGLDERQEYFTKFWNILKI